MKPLLAFILGLSVFLSLTSHSMGETSDISPAPHTLLSLPFSSETIVLYYYKSAEQNSQYMLKPEYAQKSVNFSDQEASVPLQNSRPEGQYVKTDWRYFEVGRFYSNGYTCKLILYNGFDKDNAEPFLNTQLNSYNADGRLLDALVLDSRYRADDVSEYVSKADILTRFTIEDNVIILSRDFLSSDHTLVLLAIENWIIDDGRFMLYVSAYPDIDQDSLKTSP